MFGLKRRTEPKDAFRSSRTWCRCGARAARCARCGSVYCPLCDGKHVIVWGEGSPVYVCQDAGGGSWR